MSRFLDRLAMFLVVAPVAGALGWCVYMAIGFIAGDDLPSRIVGLSILGILSLFAGIFLATRNDRGY